MLQVDEDLYSEAYRKTEYIKGNNDKVPSPFRIARILQIFTKKSMSSKISDMTDIRLKVAKFYR